MVSSRASLNQPHAPGLQSPQYPQWTGRRDKRGIPVYLYEVSKLDSKKMVAYSSSTSKSKKDSPSPSRMLRLFALYENLTRFVMPLCSAVPGRPNPETPVDQSNNIVDISKVGLKQFWNLKSHMQDASQLATAHYPETLDRIFVSRSTFSVFSEYYGLTFSFHEDPRRAVLLSYRLGLDQALVRSDHHF